MGIGSRTGYIEFMIHVSSKFAKIAKMISEG